MDEDRQKKWEMAFAARMRQIVPGLFLGNVEASYNRDMLRQNHIDAILSLTDARWVQCVDSSTQDLLAHMDSICDFIDQMASPALQTSRSLNTQQNHESNDRPSDPEAILIHCDLGISRSPTIIIAYLMCKYRMTQEEAMTVVQSKQKVKPSASFLRQLQIWEVLEYQVWEDKNKTVPKAQYQAFLNDRAARLKKKGLTGNEPPAPLNL
ncbi:putative dual specificity phosphatase Yvh1 [Aspergillus steynii IBT 23096]|uniref:protein-tyrosine-phosphatase n=1 Tax=Aspergillus steynii IBT 23096 TaxID=1392250 RepID=A0A2I2GH97_9EURO|nr:putative dual specificity phosphatase Yvh1 [Aspergillus steynii IBT 23096]PLB52261.1 putative dual specificity phosphatase Yvh1 [Aspergillus steynii IBT 23096]